MEQGRKSSWRGNTDVSGYTLTIITTPNNRASDKNPFIDDPDAKFKKDLNCYQIQL